jgi:hypothetical protein
MGLSLLGWIAIGLAAIYYYEDQHGRRSVFVTVVGIILAVAYLVLGSLNRRAVNRWRATGERWHSKSKGQSLFGKENRIRDFGIEVVIFTGLCFVSIFYAGFFLLSRLMSYLADATAIAALYNRYLDIIDAQIESQFMETALREGFPPDTTGGIYTPLPGAFKGERRANVARIIAGGPIANPGPEPASPKQQVSRSAAAASAIPSQPVDLKSAFQDAKGTVAEILAGILKSKRLVRIAVFVFLLAALVAVAIPVGRFIRYEMKRPTPAVTSEPSQPLKVYREIPATSAPQPQSQSRSALSAVTPPPMVHSTAAAQASSEQNRRSEDQKTTGALEEPQREKDTLVTAESAKPQERENAIEQINATLTNQTAQLYDYRTNCIARLDDNTNKIAKVASSSRKSLTKLNAHTREMLVNQIQGQEDFLKQFKESLPALLSNPRLEPKLILVHLNNSIAKIVADRKDFEQTLDSIDTTISNFQTAN